MSKAAVRSAKPSALSRKYITRALPVGAVINCADNSGARTLKIVQVFFQNDSQALISYCLAYFLQME